MDVIEFQRLFVKFRLIADTLELPGGNVAEISIITLCLAVWHLVFNTEMAAAGLFPDQRILAEQFGKFEEIGNTAGIFKLLIHFAAIATDVDV